MSGLRLRNRRRAWPLIIAVAVLATLAACGKKAGLEPPDDTTASYTYPRPYPDPASVLPDTEKPSTPSERPPPPTAGSLTPFPADRTTTTIYRSGPSQ